MIGGMSSLRVTLETHLPEALPAGSRTALFCFGRCFDRAERVASLEVVVDGVRYRPTAFAMPRRDVYDWLAGGPEDPQRRSYRSGWWATVPVSGGSELAAAVRVAGGSEERVPLDRIGVASPAPFDAEVPPGAIAICMATFDPDPSLLRVQLDSIRAQSDERWVCLISDGGSSEEGFGRLVEAVGDDPRFTISRSQERLGPYRNFERVLSMVPSSATLVALSDQDDRWYPDKLAALRGALGPARLVYSDQRIVTDDGRVLRDSLWHGRRNDYRNLASLLVANSMPGAAMLFRRELLDVALPFPDAPGRALSRSLARAGGACERRGAIRRPAAVRLRAARRGGARGSGRAAVSAWVGALAGRVLRRVRDALGAGADAAAAMWTPQSPRANAGRCRGSWRAERSPICFLWLALRPLRRLVGRDETLSGEVALACGIVWRWLVAFARVRLAQDASFPDPPRFEQRRLRRWRAGA